MYEQFYLHCNVPSDAGRYVTLCKLFYVTSDAWLSVTLYCSNGFTLRYVIVALQVTLDVILTHKCINGFTLRYCSVPCDAEHDLCEGMRRRKDPGWEQSLQEVRGTVPEK